MKKAVITMGLPASGKSTGLMKNIKDLDNYIILDSDKIKELHPDYNPKTPELLHEWSKNELEKQILKALNENQNLIIDTTGTNVEKMFRYLKQLKNSNYNVTLLYVSVTKENSLLRNAKRTRNVPESIIHQKSEVIDFSFNALKNYFDDYIKFDNN